MNAIRLAGLLGTLAPLLFTLALIFFGLRNPEFSFLEDYVSQLGAQGEPNALGWNLTGFVAVGLLLSGFGLMYGKIIGDRLVSCFLAGFGVGFALTSLPMDMSNSETLLSKAHIVAICLGLASWLFGLARIGYNQHLKKSVKLQANIAAILLVLSIVGFVLGFWSMPVTHRLVFAVVFGWTVLVSVQLLSSFQKPL